MWSQWPADPNEIEDAAVGLMTTMAQLKSSLESYDGPQTWHRPSQVSLNNDPHGKQNSSDILRHSEQHAEHTCQPLATIFLG